MGRDTVLRTILTATAVAGTLDILSAFLFAGMAGVNPMGVLLFVASGPFGDRVLTQPAFALVGLLVHFGIMICMVSAFVLAALRLPILTARPLVSGVLYGLVLWFFMYWIVQPTRWENIQPPSALWPITNQLISHVLLVGIPIALIAARRMRRLR